MSTADFQAWGDRLAASHAIILWPNGTTFRLADAIGGGVRRYNVGRLVAR